MDGAVRVGRAVVKDVFGGAFAGGADLLVEVRFLPLGEARRLVERQVGLHWEVGFRQVESRFQRRWRHAFLRFLGVFSDDKAGVRLSVAMEMQEGWWCFTWQEAVSVMHTAFSKIGTSIYKLERLFKDAFPYFLAGDGIGLRLRDRKG